MLGSRADFGGEVPGCTIYVHLVKKGLGARVQHCTAMSRRSCLDA